MIGKRLGPYEILARIGAGGMGEVFKARDTRLDRNVAIKMLPAELARSAQLRLRFEREAKTISQLNHPHICALYDVGDDYLVMELLEGETLADRIARGPLPLSDVLRYGVQIAEALDRAHRSGVVHRDLKPGNIMLTKSGAKLLDFGLAKVSGTIGIDADAATQQKSLTQEGTILGTFQYMAPEQLEGVDADARTDIFALGAVLYEMATGRRAFDGKTKTSLIAAIVSSDPRPISEVQPLTPTSLEQLIRGCLAKDREERVQTAHDVALQLKWIETAAAPAKEKARVSRRGVVIAALVALTLGTIGGWLAHRATRKPQRFVSAIVGANGEPVAFHGSYGGCVVSPDGNLIAFAAPLENGTTQLWIRDFRSGAVRVLPGSEGAAHPFWSPDSRHVGYFSENLLKRSDASGGQPTVVATLAIGGGRGGVWASDGTIYFAPTSWTPIQRIPASGGPATDVTKLDAARHTTHRWPALTPDGQHIVYLAANHRTPEGEQTELRIVRVDGSGDRLLLKASSNPVIAAGRLLYVRDGTLVARRITPAGALEGDPLTVGDRVLYDSGFWLAGFSANDNGLLVYHAGEGDFGARLAWVDRGGKVLSYVGGDGRYFDIELAPDEKSVLLGIGDPTTDVYLHDLERDVRTRLTFGEAQHATPLWSADGATIYFARQSGGSVEIWRMPAATRRAERLSAVPSPTLPLLWDLAPDGIVTGTLERGDLVLFSLASRKFTTLLATPQFEGQARISPDARWIAYLASEGKREDVFVSSYPDMAARWQVSSGGGRSPRWSADGKTLYFITADDRLHEVPVATTGAALSLGAPKPLFQMLPRVSGVTDYDVTKDGQRFLVRARGAGHRSAATLVQNGLP